MILFVIPQIVRIHYPRCPLYEYDLQPTIQALKFLKQSFESYLNEFNFRTLKISNEDEQKNDDEGYRSVQNEQQQQQQQIESLSNPNSPLLTT